MELDVAGLVDTVNVTEAGSDGEVGGDGGEGGVNLPDILGLGVERVVVNIFVVDTVLLTTGDACCAEHVSRMKGGEKESVARWGASSRTDLHLEPLLHGGNTLEVPGTGVSVSIREVRDRKSPKRTSRSTYLAVVSMFH